MSGVVELRQTHKQTPGAHWPTSQTLASSRPVRDHVYVHIVSKTTTHKTIAPGSLIAEKLIGPGAGVEFQCERGWEAAKTQMQCRAGDGWMKAVTSLSVSRVRKYCQKHWVPPGLELDLQVTSGEDTVL